MSKNQIRLINGYCEHVLSEIQQHSIDLILQDPPYDVTKNSWDKSIDLELLWKQWLRIIKPNGAIIFTTQQPFTTDLINSARDLFRYDIVVIKTNKKTNFLNAAIMPLRHHEQILIFYQKQPTYNPQKTKGKPNHTRGTYNTIKLKKDTNNNYSKFNPDFEGEISDNKYPTDVIEFQWPHPAIHPTQKPVDLMRYLIRTYSNPGDIVFDGYAGVGTTALACIKEKRRFIGAEKEKAYFDIAYQHIQAAISEPELF